MVQRVTRTLQEQCVHRHRVETFEHASRNVGGWIRFYNNQRPHQALGGEPPIEVSRFAAQLEQESLRQDMPIMSQAT
ncbi:integrase core domain-containing protein [Massilia putida]|uniref:integrase core domain-containing protein n=1 Tax=Massilia putida TaxID=1141883 RepID=UPI0009527296|nr:integrase core domain-containing protein [Massilia putida]